MMSKSFGDTLKQHRYLKGMTQVELCHAVGEILKKRGVEGAGLTQPTLSAWEVNRQTPSGENLAVLQALETVLKLKPSVVKAVLSQTGRRAGSAPDDAYADDVQEWVKSVLARTGARTGVTAARPSIFFLGPNTIPLFLDVTERLFKLWKSNVMHGVHYHLWWILEETTDGTAFTKLGEYLEKLYDSIAEEEGVTGFDAKAWESKGFGKVHVSLFHRPPSVMREAAADSLARNKNVREFERIANQWPCPPAEDRCPLVVWVDRRKESHFKEKDASRRMYDLIENVRSQLFGRLAVYTGGQTAEAGLLLVDTASRMGGEPSRMYRWMVGEQAEQLGYVANEIEAWIKNGCLD